MPDELHIYTDGASRGNPGPSAIAFSIYSKEGGLLCEYSQRIGNGTNNEAEYKAVIAALEKAAKHTRGSVFIYSDSELVLKQIKGLFRIRQQHLLELFRIVKKEEKNFSSVKYINKPRSHLKLQRVDSLANEALDGKVLT